VHVPFTVASSLPANEATDVRLGAVVEVTFSDFPDPATIAAPAVALRSGVNTVDAVITTDLVDKKVVLRPSMELTADTDYVVEINSRVAGLSGLELGRTSQVRFRTGTMAGGGPQVLPTPTLAEVQQVFDGYNACADPASGCGCARAGCHGAVAPALLLNLTASAMHFNLVGITTTQPSGQIPGMKLARVKAGNPSESYLLRKLLGTPDIRGGRMPLDGEIDQEQLRLISRWIAGGAPK
jgi:hypothetical protein